MAPRLVADYIVRVRHKVSVPVGTRRRAIAFAAREPLSALAQSTPAHPCGTARTDPADDGENSVGSTIRYACCGANSCAQLDVEPQL